jgi:phenylacetate-CoA ligase
LDKRFEGLLTEMADAERASPPSLAAYQAELLEELVQHARTNVPFYRERLACLSAAAGDLDLARWNDVPILERAEAIRHGTALRATRYPEYCGGIIESRTSGSSGAVLHVATNEFVSTVSNAALTRMAGWFRLDTSRPLAAIRSYANEEMPQYPQGSTRTGWSHASPKALLFGLDFRATIAEQLDWLARKQAPYLLTPPANAMALAYAVTPEQGRRLGIEFIFGVGETVIPGAREIVADRLGARLAGIYSCQEVGAVAMECPVQPHYHVVAENVLVEIVDDNGRDVPFGGFGRVLLTGLRNYAMPFIRYAIGDVATAGAGMCACGRSLPVIAQIEGRTRMAFVFKDGTRFWPRVWNARAMQAFVPCRECQIVQVDHERIEFRYVPDGSGRPADLEGLTAYARQIMHPSITIVPLAMDTLPRGPGGKFEQIISLVSAEPTPSAPT